MGALVVLVVSPAMEGRGVGGRLVWGWRVGLACVDLLSLLPGMLRLICVWGCVR